MSTVVQGQNRTSHANPCKTTQLAHISPYCFPNARCFDEASSWNMAVYTVRCLPLHVWLHTPKRLHGALGFASIPARKPRLNVTILTSSHWSVRECHSSGRAPGKCWFVQCWMPADLACCSQFAVSGAVLLSSARCGRSHCSALDWWRFSWRWLERHRRGEETYHK